MFAPQLAALWPLGPVQVASTLSGSTVGEIAGDLLATAPPRFALAGISMGGYVCLEVMRRAPERVVKLALLNTSTRPDSRPGLARIAVPTLVLVGDSDPLTPPDRSEEMAAAFPSAELVVVPTCGHGSMLEQPDAVNRAIAAWLSR